MTKVTMRRRRFVMLATVAAGLLFFGVPALAQSNYPNKPIRLVVPFRLAVAPTS
jgi:tripartite-type tricarboxylate transporter receptor subunit TctC